MWGVDYSLHSHVYALTYADIPEQLNNLSTN